MGLQGPPAPALRVLLVERGFNNLVPQDVDVVFVRPASMQELLSIQVPAASAFPEGHRIRFATHDVLAGDISFASPVWGAGGQRWSGNVLALRSFDAFEVVSHQGEWLVIDQPSR